jgi:hypothetical protein
MSAPQSLLEFAPPHGWYGPPNSRRFHYFTNEAGRSLCGKWLVFSWSADLIDVAYGPANGDCAACKRLLEKAKADAST